MSVTTTGPVPSGGLPSPRAGSSDSAADSRPRSLLFVSFAFVILAAHLFLLIAQNAVNILWWDQWAFYDAFFNPHSLWQLFDYQYATARMGPGLLLDGLVASLTRWNTRAEDFALGAALCCAALAALYLKRRLFGALEYSDAAIPLIFLTPVQYESFLGAASFSFGILPLLLCLLLCLAWLVPRRAVRYALVLSLNFLMVYTSYGLFMGAITPVLFALDARLAWKSRDRAALAGSLAAVLLSAASLASCLIGLKFVPMVDCFRFPYGNGFGYARYAALIFADNFGFHGTALAPSLVGAVLLVSAVAAALHHLRRLWLGRDASGASRVLLVLLAFGLIYCTGASAGRLCQGFDSAAASRFATYMIPAIFGLYLHLFTMRRTRLRSVALALLVAGALYSGVLLGRHHAGRLGFISNGKRMWRSCYLRTENIAACDASTGFLVLPEKYTEGLAYDLAFLKRNRLNLYSGN